MSTLNSTERVRAFWIQAELALSFVKYIGVCPALIGVLGQNPSPW